MIQKLTSTYDLIKSSEGYQTFVLWGKLDEFLINLRYFIR